MKLIRNFVVLAIAILFTLTIFSSAQNSEKSEGAALFKSHCAMCHGADAKGNTPIGKMDHVVDLHSAQVQNKTDAELVTLIENGKGKMPAFKDKLKPEQIKDLASYIKGMKADGTTK